jgi:hypothetical protein
MVKQQTNSWSAAYAKLRETGGDVPFGDGAHLSPRPCAASQACQSIYDSGTV